MVSHVERFVVVRADVYGGGNQVVCMWYFTPRRSREASKVEAPQKVGSCFEIRLALECRRRAEILMPGAPDTYRARE